MHVKKANESEIDLIIELLIEKSDWLMKKNMPSWDKRKISKTLFQEKYVSPIYFICSENNIISSTFILLESDKLYWPNENINDSFYLHKFMVCNDFNGSRYSDKVLDWIKDYGREKNKKYLRLDFNTHNHKVKNIYLSNGFKIVEEIKNHTETGYDMSKAEYKL